MFYALRNLFALIGVAAVILAIILSVKMAPLMQAFESFDERAIDVYTDMMTKIVETGNAAEATVWKVPVDEDMSVEDVEETMRFVANEHNIKNVGELPLSGQIEAMTGKKSRFLKIYMFCNALTAAQMLEYNDAYSAYLPCRISLVEDKQGKMWLYTLNMDAMIYGGLPLPPALKTEAENVKTIILDIMNRGAEGDF
ncbi:MAG: hypothetical protein COB77_04825 [Gammaproteobacteria bacterium]|nr:MAG: hypothetical protein COB77_04825 [Gammaproteobacteria bacterium]